MSNRAPSGEATLNALVVFLVVILFGCMILDLHKRVTKLEHGVSVTREEAR